MRDVNSSQESVKPSIENSKEQNQKRANRSRIYWVSGLIVIFIVVPVYFSIHPSPADWAGMDKSDETSQVTTEEVDGKITKTTKTTKFEQAKTLWDWMNLLLAPAFVAGLGFLFQSSQERAKVAREELERKTEEAAKEIAAQQAEVEKDRAEKQAQAEKDRVEDRQRGDVLEAYINSISDLLVGKSLSILAKQKARGLLTNTDRDLLDAGMGVIRARTLSIFRRFTDYKDSKRTDGDRKGSILVFLYDTGLIRNLKENEQGQKETEAKQFQALLFLDGADLSGANLFRANLIGANFFGVKLGDTILCLTDLGNADLSNADLSNANLSHANLQGANLHYADLVKANLRHANLRHADLRDVDFSGANLSGANLSHANLSGALLDQADLRRAILLAVDLSQTELPTIQKLEGIEKPLLCKVKLPKDIEVDPSRDCKELPGILARRYPKQFKTLEEAQAYVDQQPTP